ncbi:Tat binding protein 1-interacting protein-domain-containing protein [Rhexocercosporidium sp. MPI-PUGE-AT-0058]|nr:Tat binding protein 1-interacting protein-domain-containing protein [Rhexocercosporidium sp. MPI-PUGE-AT-0058]
MAPRKPKADDDAASTTSTDVPSVLKPKTEKAKVEKPPKSEKPKVAKPKAGKKEKEKVDVEGASGVKEKSKGGKKEKDTLASVGKGVGEDGEGKMGGKDGKEKVKPVTGEEAMELIAAYLKMQNRPYSATEVSLNLHGKVTKTVADKLLKEMEQNGQIKGKASKSGTGGQWVFWSIQDPADSASPEELAAMDISITTLRDCLPTLKANLKTHTTKLNTLRSALTAFELASAVEQIRAENQAKREKLRGLKEGVMKTVTTEEVEKVEKDLKYWAAKRFARKKAFENLEGVLRDGMTKEDIWEKAGIEEDVY